MFGRCMLGADSLGRDPRIGTVRPQRGYLDIHQNYSLYGGYYSVEPGLREQDVRVCHAKAWSKSLL